MKGRKIFSLILAVLLLMSCMPLSLFAAQEDDTYFNKLMRSNYVSKAQIVIIRDGRIEYTYNYGCKDNDKFKVFAISKSVLGILAAKMQDDGIINLDTNIETYWRQLSSKNVSRCSDDWYKYYGNAGTIATNTDSSKALVENSPTLRNCLTHSSTIKNGYMWWKDSKKGNGEFFGGSIGSNYGMATFMLAHTWGQLFESGAIPGKTTEYNPNRESLTREHALAGFTMQIATNVSLNEYLKNEIFDVIGAESNPGFRKLKWTKKFKDGTTEFIPMGDVAATGNSIEFATSYETSAVDLAKLITIILNNGMYGSTRIMSEDAVDEIKRVETNLKNQTIAFNYANGKYEKSGRYAVAEFFGRYNLSQGNNYSYVSFDPEARSGLVVTVTGKSTAFKYKRFINAVSKYEAQTFKYVHKHEFTGATCTEPAKCFCGETTGEPLGHTFGTNGRCIRCKIECPHLKLTKDWKCGVCGKSLNIQRMDVNKFPKVFKNYTEIRGSTCVAKNNGVIQVLDKDAIVLVDDESKAVVEGSNIKVIAPGKFNVVLLKDNQYSRASFFSWNASLKGKVGCYFYSDANRTEKIGVIYANVYFALEKTDQPKMFKVKEIFYSGGRVSGQNPIGSYITNYYNNPEDERATQYYTYSFGF